MKNFYFTICFVLLSFWSYSQNGGIQKQYSHVPEAYQSHPELGKKSHSATLHNVDYELVQNRTQFSRTFLNTNKTKTTVQSSVPLHYQDNMGFWRSIEYKAQELNGKISYPVQNPFFEVDAKSTAFILNNQAVKLGQTKLSFVSGDAVVKTISGATKKNGTLENDNKISFKNVSPGVDKNISLYHQAMKYSYMINTPEVLTGQFDYLLVEEIITLPGGFSMKEDESNNNLTVINDRGEETLVFQRPLISDSKVGVRNARQNPYAANYQLMKLTENSYKIQVKIDAAWLKSANRVFPLNIDPVVTVTNNDVVNSCFVPSYQQSVLMVNVPAGETILSSNISYDFVATEGSGSYMSDQRSFVVGPNGQTPVASGVGNEEGMYTYNITDSPIGNVTSTGQIQYTFNFGRSWGGNGCDAAFNFVDRREVSVTYGTLEFGSGPLMINEYSASNRYFNDGFNRNEDWIELYNASPDTYFNLAGYHLSNNVNNPTKWQIQNGVIPPNSRVLIFCSNRDISSGTVLHASFDLTQTDSDEVVIADPDGNIIESHEMYITQTNHSYGRTSDGAATWGVFSTATPGQQNVNGFASYTTKPTIDIAPGKYPGPISVALSSSGENEQVRYTLDGSTPTVSSPLYSAPISITQSTVIRARAFSTTSAIIPGFIETNTYLINDNSSLPVVSLSGGADMLTLLNGTQIEPIGYLEYFESDGTFVDENMGDFDKHGNDSWAYAQRGVDFISRDDHGYKRRLEHQFFDTSDRTTYRRLILKAAGSDNYPHQSGGAHMRDVFVQKVSEVANLEMDERRSSFVSLFVNGQYWGVYDLREKVDDNQYTDYYYGQDYLFRDSDNYIQYIKTWGGTYPEFGNQPAIDAWDDLLDFVQDNDMALEANYNYVDSQLNINSLIDYFVLNSYMVNKDWLNWNTSWWRGLDPSGGALKWRYALWDCDGVLGHYYNYTGIPDITADANPCDAEALDVGVGHAQTIQKLVEESPIVRQRYVARYADLLNTHLSCAQVTQIFDEIVAEIAPEMPRQIARWGGSMATWQANVQEARDFLMTRCSQTISSGMVDCYEVTGPFETIFQVEPAAAGEIRMNSEWLTTYPFTAQIFGNLQTLLTAQANTGYVFSHWVIDGVVVEDTDPNLALEISQATSITAQFAELTVGEQALIYWHFNTLVTPEDVTSIPADYNVVMDVMPLMTYTGTGPRDIDATDGSIVNLHFDEPSGSSARVRNPSDGRSLVFDLPTVGYKDIKFAYAVMRTNNGQLVNNIAYSLDGGLTFTQAGLAQTAFTTNPEYTLVEVDFSSILAVNDNALFKVQITFEGNTSGDSGNNRYDNITLKGVENTLSVPSQNVATYQVYPNPFSNTIQIISSEMMTEVSVYDMVGKSVWKKANVNKTTESFDLDTLSAGMYLLKIKTSKGLITHKLVKK
jgi:hypothetical protein